MKLTAPTSLATAMGIALLVGCAADTDTRAHPPVEQQPRGRVDAITHARPGSVAAPKADSDLSVSLRDTRQVPPHPEEYQGRSVETRSLPAPEGRLNSQAGVTVEESFAQQKRQDIAPPAQYRPQLHYSEPPVDRERYAKFVDNGVKQVATAPLSTFGLDVDTASYALARRNLRMGQLPHPESVRVEEWLNYHRYQYPTPEDARQPFSIYTEVAPSPWASGRHLMLIGLKGYEVPRAELPPANLTFLIDVSGSMGSADKLPLLKQSLKLLTRQLRPEDRVSIVVYAGAAGVVLESTPGNRTLEIEAALDRLQAGGSTAGGAGIQLAYRIARQHRIEGGINRVLVCTDNDWNVGTTNTEALKKMVARERQSGVELSVFTFGRGNIRDELANALAEIGNGNAAYIDSALEARKALVQQLSGTLMTIAKDVKFQVEFNPAAVAEYRLIGYETRHLEAADFRDDTKDAGEMGAGHQVTALYEITLTGSEAVLTPPLRYRDNAAATPDDADSGELAYLKLRYKQPEGQRSALLTRTVKRSEIRGALNRASDDLRWAAAVSGAAQHARGNGAIGVWGYRDSLNLAAGALGEDPQGYRAEFLRLMEIADALDPVRPPLADNYGAH